MPQRNWLITGVSSGFGRIMTKQLLARGDRIAGTVRDLSVMDDLKAKYGDRLSLACVALAGSSLPRTSSLGAGGKSSIS
jgi:short-subunit dehydrogenase